MDTKQKLAASKEEALANLRRTFKHADILHADILKSDPPRYYENSVGDPEWMRSLNEMANESIKEQRRKIAFLTANLIGKLKANSKKNFIFD